MRAGTLRERIKFQRPITATDPEWGARSEWADVTTVWASVLSSGGSESQKDQGVQATVKYTIRLRYLAGIDSTHRIVWEGRTLDIVSVIDPDNRRHELLIEAAEHQENS